MLDAELSLSPLGRAVVESDRQYFELAAATEPLPGATLAFMPGLESLPAASVVHRVEPERVDAPLAGWLALVESRARSLHLSHLRLYLTFEAAAWTSVLNRHGFTQREEVLFYAPVMPCAQRDVALVPVEEPRDWKQRAAVFQGDEKGSDSHPFSPCDWVELERRKVQTNGLRCLNVLYKNEIAAAVGYLKIRDFFRIKNLHVRRAWRRQRVGSRVVRAMRAHAYTLQARGCGVMAVNGSHAARLYRETGMERVGVQYEWMKSLI